MRFRSFKYRRNSGDTGLQWVEERRAQTHGQKALDSWSAELNFVYNHKIHKEMEVADAGFNHVNMLKLFYCLAVDDMYTCAASVNLCKAKASYVR